MASSKKPVVPSSSFSSSMLQIAHRFSLFTAFDDFLTMALAAVTQNLHTGESWYEQEYLAAMEKYKSLEIRHEFPKACASLITEMEARIGSSEGNDVLGEFFEQYISNGKNGQFFTPYHVCMMMASITCGEQVSPEGKVQRIIDPTCGSGRMLVASSRILGPRHEYYGIDIDPPCIKMSALNLFLNGVWNSEVMCANAVLPADFSFSYRISLLPLGIFKIEDNEKSKLWHLYNASFEKEVGSDSIVLNPVPFSERKKDDGTQLPLF
ncbi:MAG: SAM-dependent DNA methyltransferase [Chitinophagaceae bacterium]|nr:SAM-dependent DNA methyltransferase [Chitinophagaceae bacterium]